MVAIPLFKVCSMYKVTAFLLAGSLYACALRAVFTTKWRQQRGTVTDTYRPIRIVIAKLRIRAVLGSIALGVLLSPTGALLLQSSLDITQYAHNARTIRDGFLKGTVRSIVQTPDGYLWLAKEFGLVRFDGVRSSPWQAPAGQHLPDKNIYGLTTKTGFPGER